MPYELPQQPQMPQQPMQQEPGREGMLGPEQSVLQKLLGEDQKLRDPNQSSTQLIQAMNMARGQGQMQDMRAIRNIIEGRHTDDIARGPQQQTDPVTSSDPNEQSWWQRMNPFAKAGNAMSDAGQRALEAERDKKFGR